MNPLVSLRWSQFTGFAGYDIHLVRDNTGAALTTGRLDGDLLIGFLPNGLLPAVELTGQRINQLPLSQRPDGFALTFEPASANLLTRGVVVDPATGAVTIRTPPDGLRNFILNARVNHTNQSLPIPLRLPIRVHIHDSIVALTLTPSPLTLPVGTRGRFTALASFSDISTGDVTRHSQLITWASGNTAIADVDATGFITTSAKGSTTITATPNAPFVIGQVPAAVGQLTVSTAWQDLQPRLTLLPGGPGLKNVATAPNYVFVSEGFAASESKLFFQLVRDLELRLKTNDTTSPFKLLRSQVNMFAAFVPSRENGASVVDEITTTDRGTGLVANPIPVAIRPDNEHPGPAVPGDARDISTLSHLIYRVGLPTSLESGNTFAQQTAIWRALHGDTFIRGATEALFNEWLKLASRALLLERDTAFGLRQGTRPYALPPSAQSVFTWNPYRSQRSELDGFLGQSVTSAGTKIGATWADATGKDRNRVIMLCHSARRGGFRTSDDDGPLTAVPMNDNLEVPVVIGVPPLALRIPALAAHLVPSAHLTAAHEMAHSLLCGDEYGGDAALVSDVTEPYGNVQLATELANLDATKIKWRYARLRAAGQVVGRPTKSGNDIRATLPKAHVQHIAGAFTAAEIAAGTAFVHLRLRPLTIRPTPLNPQAPVSPRMFLRTSGATEGDTVLAMTVAAADSAALDTWLGQVTSDQINAGLVLMAPQLDAGNVVIELLHPRIRSFITSSGFPLNRKAGNCGPPPLVAPSLSPPSSVQPPLNLPKNGAGQTIPPNPFIVGLYDGGVNRFCGIFHAAGSCLMNSTMVKEERSLDPRIGVRVDEKHSAPGYFCPVCRYLIVDQLDPSKHAEIDAEYRPVYDTIT